MGSTGLTRILLVVWLMQVVVQGQPVFTTYKSLEAQVAEAESVFRGRLTKVSQKILVRPGGFETNLSQTGEGKVVAYKNELPLGRSEYVLEVKVEEKFKGAEDRTARLVVKGSGDDKRFEEWMKEERELLWFARRSADSEEREWWWIWLTDSPEIANGLPVFSMRFDCIAGQKEIVDRVRELSKQQFPDLKLHTFNLPMSVVQRCHPAHVWGFLEVPVDRELEKLARRLIVSPEDFLPGEGKQEQNRLKAEGIRALGYFKSKENTELLKSVLGNPSFTVEHDGEKE